MLMSYLGVVQASVEVALMPKPRKHCSYKIVHQKSSYNRYSVRNYAIAKGFFLIYEKRSCKKTT